MFSKVVIILGGNKGDREDLLEKAILELAKAGKFIGKSSIYETEAWGGVANGAFLNQVVQLETNLNPEQFLELIQKIEFNLGRKRDEHWGDRTMDIDILYFDQRVISNSLLQIPHPFIAQRRFVLVPLVEVLPKFMHPILGKNHLKLLEECKDETKVLIYKPS
ncbi:MAG: 2-amino-4-hydroxy-6-hydroxymethyldihydropteridine diphosphokinase [Algoriphagus sp.]|uniref:2-amino-4-hydroxy-6- hydroxymethyldihydropteridine diphosphokinase n=1 Tax=Algoriphagus sp. TaxID=1872435 RepID=UPI00261B48A3|nr:2-amino-4-hydroxy-6-hydroxymethyldihydropteridine diphosphokinase [Algoriphagus sp.]MDG1276952.1 2-amino-4-hydroxy-6-hydroxymethyldihydropteridine diphosphokinase [Algoriphagus sp.]